MGSGSMSSIAHGATLSRPFAGARLPGWAVYLRTMGLFCLVWYAASALTPNKLLLPSPIDVALALREGRRSARERRSAD